MSLWFKHSGVFNVLSYPVYQSESQSKHFEIFSLDSLTNFSYQHLSLLFGLFILFQTAVQLHFAYIVLMI